MNTLRKNFFHKNTKNLPIPLEVRKTHRGPTPCQDFLCSKSTTIPCRLYVWHSINTMQTNITMYIWTLQRKKYVWCILSYWPYATAWLFSCRMMGQMSQISLRHILEWEQCVLYYEPTFKLMRFIDLSFILQIDIEETTCHLNMSHLKIYPQMMT